MVGERKGRIARTSSGRAEGGEPRRTSSAREAREGDVPISAWGRMVRMAETDSGRRVQMAILVLGKAWVAARATEPPMRPGAKIVILAGFIYGW